MMVSAEVNNISMQQWILGHNGESIIQPQIAFYPKL
jgi:hypothetical protein